MESNNKTKFEFEVPDGYFNTLADRVMDKIKDEDLKKSQRKSLIFKIVLPLAAAVLVGIGIYNHLLMPKHSVILESNSDYVSQYKSDIVRTLSDDKIIEYLTITNSDVVHTTQQDFSDMVDTYPSPINY